MHRNTNYGPNRFFKVLIKNNSKIAFLWNVRFKQSTGWSYKAFLLEETWAGQHNSLGHFKPDAIKLLCDHITLSSVQTAWSVNTVWDAS